MARLAIFKTDAQRKAAAKRALKSYADGKTDRYEIIRKAEMFGWSDPGYTEPLNKTVDRAVAYLAKIAGVTVARANPKFKTGPGAKDITKRAHGGVVAQKKEPRYVVKKAGAHGGVVKRNPTGGRDYRKAVSLYRDFTGEHPKFVDEWEVAVPAVAMQIGRCTGVMYIARVDGKNQEFLHEFTGKSRPILAASANGKQMLFLGGDYKMTERGIVDGSYEIER